MEANEAMKAMADRIADKMYPRTHPGWIGGQHCALAAIMETQARDAALCDEHGSTDDDAAAVADAIAHEIRSGEHYRKEG